MGKHDFSLDVAVSPEGQEEVARCRPGQTVRLLREFDNPQDDMAVGVYSVRRIRIGPIPWERSKWIGEKLDVGVPVWAIVERVALGEDGTRSLTIRINLNGQEPRLPLAETLPA